MAPLMKFAVEIECSIVERVSQKHLDIGNGKNFAGSANQAQIAALQGNFSEKKNFLKKVGSNPLLRERLVFVEYKNPWKLLENSSAEARGPAQQQAVCGVNSAPSEAGNANFTNWLRGLDSNQDYMIQSHVSCR